MNINSTSSVDNTSIANLAKGSAGQSSQDSANAEPSSFLDKLTSLLFSAKGDTQVTKHDEASMLMVASSDGAHSEVELTPSEYTDAPHGLSESEPSPSLDASVDAALVRASTEPHSELFPENKSAQVMNEGDDLLVRLQQANQTLTGHNGKPLPHRQFTEYDDTETAIPIAAERHSHSDNGTLPVETQAMYGATTQDHRYQYDDKGQLKNTAISNESDDLDAYLASFTVTPEHAMVPTPLAPAQSSTDSEIIDGEAGELVLSTDDIDVEPSLSAQATYLSANQGVHASPRSMDSDLAKVEDNTDSQDGARSKKAVAVGVSAALAGASSLGTSQPASSSASVAMNNAASREAEVNAAITTNRVAAQTLTQPTLLEGQGVNAALASSTLLAGATVKARSASDGDEHSLAQQIAATATQSGVNGSTPLRHEATPIQAQTLPLMLNKGLVADEMAERVQMMMSKNLKNIDIRLDPPELGRLHIRMNMHADGANIQFTVTNVQARDALEGAMPRLREMLAQQGVQLADTSVQQQSSGQQQGYAAERGSAGHLGDDDPLFDDENIDANVKLDLNVTTKRDGISYYA
ncbi:flagellar hook-length control protein FliK [Vibrio sp. 11986-1-5]|uniref:flagellar hook-length control protein FliK n=1 Tax=Vibrio sp. 11986-1-5 TaxID=2211215 RepID=UPI000D730B6E|nr:flagellar hook-length control protein FliK [Vibrio sp. 11986-1-5]PXA74590.1 hypothetical protein DMC15_00915 [Vibrio sp. 11986-1-5]